MRLRSLMKAAPSTLRVVAALALLQALFVTAYVAPGHNARPHDLPVAVVGSSAAAKQVADRLTQGHLSVRRLGDAAQAQDAIRERDVYGAFLLDGDRPVVLTASAASIAAQQVIVAAAAGAHVPPGDIHDVVPLTGNDPRGVALSLLVLPLLVTSIIGAALAQALMGRASTLRRRLVTLGIAAAAAGTATTVVAGPIFGILPGNFFAEAGLIALGVGAILMIADGLMRLVGAAGLGLTFFLFLVVGNPASGTTTAPEFVPAPWHQIGEVLLPGPLVNALRSTAYFHGQSLSGPLIALMAAAAFGFALQVTAAHRSTRADRLEARAPVRRPSVPLSSPVEG